MGTAIRLVLAALALALVLAGAWFGRTVPVAEQWPMFEALRTTAAIIFAVVGAWMAIIYPERMKMSFRGTKPKEAPQDTGQGRLSQLFFPVIHSTLILGVVLVLGALLPVLRHNPPDVPVEYMRGISYGLLVTLTLWQLWTVILTMVPADQIKSMMDREIAAQDTRHGMTRLWSNRGPRAVLPADEE